MSIKSLLERITSIPSGEAIMVITHANADPDAVAAAFTVKNTLEHLGFVVLLCFPEGISRLAKDLLEKLGLTYENNCSCNVHYAVVCDASNEVMLSGAAECLKNAEIIVIDHHEPGNLLQRSSVAVVEPEEPAATTLAVELAQLAGINLEPRIATLALGGILYDTRRFSLASPRTLRAAAWLLEQGGNYEVAMPRSDEALSYSEKIARLKAVQRSIFIDVCGTIIAVTEVTAYEASVARALVSVGADIVFVVGGKDELRVSARTSERVLSSGFDVAAVSRRIADALGGEGGGHRGAAGVKIRKELPTSSIMRVIINEVTRELLSTCGK